MHTCRGSKFPCWYFPQPHDIHITESHLQKSFVLKSTPKTKITLEDDYLEIWT